MSRPKTLLIATALVWLVAYAAWTADWVIQPMPHLVERSLRRIPMCLFGMGICLVIAEVLRRAGPVNFAMRVGIGVILCLLAALAYSATGVVMFSVIAPLWGVMTLGDVLASSIADAWVFLAWLALYFAIAADADARDARIALADAQTAEQRALNQALAQQINPHFLFNALNAVSGLILEGDGVRAERVTMALSALLRRSLERDLVERVTLAEEIDAIRRYVEIEEIRFEGRFRFIDAVPPAERAFRVPSLILQPLVENVMKHGVARSTGLVTLEIAADGSGETVEITVTDDASEDNILGLDRSPGIGIGQGNTRHRLKLLYGETATLICGRRDEGGYQCTLSLPKRSGR